MGFLLIKWEEREGLKAKGPLIPSPPPRRRTGEAARVAGGGQSGRSGPRRRPGSWGKGGRGYWDLIPGTTLGWDGSMRWGDEGQRRRADVAAAAALQGRGGGRAGLGRFEREWR